MIFFSSMFGLQKFAWVKMLQWLRGDHIVNYISDLESQMKVKNMQDFLPQRFLSCASEGPKRKWKKLVPCLRDFSSFSTQFHFPY